MDGSVCGKLCGLVRAGWIEVGERNMSAILAYCWFVKRPTDTGAGLVETAIRFFSGRDFIGMAFQDTETAIYIKNIKQSPALQRGKCLGCELKRS